ncbi:hypothetical protein [Rosistilla oblonga]|uniref:hypothetical protein n=1 Tax=Rosistilla oblonga TaxID=2527990 RepID=UPI0011A1F1D6|nr:hypothetical protein [Rosistilla oblonga]
MFASIAQKSRNREEKVCIYDEDPALQRRRGKPGSVEYLLGKRCFNASIAHPGKWGDTTKVIDEARDSGLS